MRGNIASFVLVLIVALALTALATAGSIEWPFLRSVVENAAAFGLTEPFAFFFAALTGWMARDRVRRKDRKTSVARKNTNQVRAQLMLNLETEQGRHLIMRDFATLSLRKRIENSDVIEYVEKKLAEASFCSPALVLDGPQGDLVSTVFAPFICESLMSSGNHKKAWCVIVPGYWEDPEDVDVIHLAAIPEKELEKYLDRNHVFETLVESRTHAPRVLFMVDAAQKHFNSEESPYVLRELPIDREWTLGNSERPDFTREAIQEAMVKLGLRLEENGVETA